MSVFRQFPCLISMGLLNRITGIIFPAHYRGGLLLFLLILLPLVSGNTQSRKLILAKFHADWCPSCKRWDSVHPGFIELKEYAEKKGIVVIVFDLTDDETAAASLLLAKKWNIEKVFREHEQSTGYALLIDALSGQKLDRLESGSANLYYLDSWFSDDPVEASDRNIKILQKYGTNQ